jgi:hypothetical protein
VDRSPLLQIPSYWQYQGPRLYQEICAIFCNLLYVITQGGAGKYDIILVTEG